MLFVAEENVSELEVSNVKTEDCVASGPGDNVVKFAPDVGMGEALMLER